MMSPKTLLAILGLFNSTIKEHYIWIEDVYITGILREELNVSLVNIQAKFTVKYEGNATFIAAHLDYLNPRQRLKFWIENV